MFGGGADVEDRKPPTKTGIRELPESHFAGGLAIGQSEDRSDRWRAKKNSQAMYQQALDLDKAKKLQQTMATGADEHNRSQLGESQLGSIGGGSPRVGRAGGGRVGGEQPSKRGHEEDCDEEMDYTRTQQQAAVMREQLKLNREDITMALEEQSSPLNSPRIKNRQELMIGVPINGVDDGMLVIGQSDAEVKATLKAKRREYMAALDSDTGNLRERLSNTARRPPRHPNHFDIVVEPTGSTSVQIGKGPSMDMSPSMKQIQFDSKRVAQEEYRRLLLAQQDDKSERLKAKIAQENLDASLNVGLPYMRANAR